ncbi:MAG: hypothetical protein DWI08_06145 [Planctomycetota bacterium]|nr:hypothetical protein [Gemmataceae bacterium]MBJ7345500.1 hypothetical protein [Gemmataceae bacterium]MBJ7497560.1 hypothetical protein [Gemmataceae bacterium]RLS60942.1 MAG: hypothetical protein DWH95_00770 [Planctomycetota bacterium]RLS86804.1 MAG: hypothetical protein DWI08_06145 [Planctomycetota bacterium]
MLLWPDRSYIFCCFCRSVFLYFL